MPFEHEPHKTYNCRCIPLPVGVFAMGEEADYLINKQMGELPYFAHRQKKKPAPYTPNPRVGKLLDDIEAEEKEEGPREPSVQTTCNRCGTPRLHWTGDKQAGTLVMRDEHGFEHKCPTFGVQLSLGQPK